jgi:hypothetical protein
MPSRCQADAKQHARQRPFTGPGALFRQRFIIYNNGSGNAGKQGLVQATVPSSDNGSGSTGKQGLVQATVPSSDKGLMQAMPSQAKDLVYVYIAFFLIIHKREQLWILLSTPMQALHAPLVLPCHKHAEVTRVLAAVCKFPAVPRHP